MGFFMVPDSLMWNYNFSTLQVIENIKYAVIAGNPKEYYHENHRPTHFLKFNRLEDDQEEEVVEKEDLFD